MQSQLFTVYVLYSESRKITYTGYSSDFILRFHFHNSFSKKGFTIKYRPWKVVHVEHFETKSQAMKREKELKSGIGREWIKTTLLPLMFQLNFIS